MFPDQSSIEESETIALIKSEGGDREESFIDVTLEFYGLSIPAMLANTVF